jgi:hypothetical protein
MFGGAPSGPAATSRPMPQAAGGGGQVEPGDGTAATGVLRAEQGPFTCGNCTHFDGQGSCDHPEIVADPEVNGQVAEGDFCGGTRYKSKTAQGGQGGEDQTAGAGEAGEAGGGAAGDTTNDQGGYA